MIVSVTVASEVFKRVDLWSDGSDESEGSAAVATASAVMVVNLVRSRPTR